MLDQVADIQERDVQRTVDRLLALLVPALTIGLGLIVAVVIERYPRRESVGVLNYDKSWKSNGSTDDNAPRSQTFYRP